eukprot:TRINITY_DN4226_c0_g1_i1.p1 TRINITY_DN4226_c0_g1~~TRINITY_DN4226_c0_g1_i1.p1  ORF type:complete len:448 (+),score=84.09 TRINITY_DN4226_c0_g1_i1:162-1505(+)
MSASGFYFRAWRILLPLLALLTLSPGIYGEISEASIVTDPRPVILFDSFGFSSHGHINMSVSGVKVYLSESSKKIDRSRMGFFIATVEEELSLQSDLNLGRCVLDNTGIHVLFTLQDAEIFARISHGGSYQFAYLVPDAREYSLFFANCEPHAVISMEVKISQYNIENGGHIDFLPAGKTHLPLLFFTFFLANVIAGAVWVVVCIRQKEAIHRIHIIMGVLIFFKAFTLLSQAGEQSHIKNNGEPQGWNIAFYIFSFCRGVMLFTVIVLIGTGWSFLKPFLQDREKKVIMIVVPLQVLANIATIVLDETGPSAREWFTWRDIFHLLDIVCCCAILFPIVWSIKHLREASHTDGMAARNVLKLTLFRQFYVMVVSYIYFTRIVVYLLRSTTPYHFAWTADFAAETAALVFYSVTGYLFRPVPSNPYFALSEEEEAAALATLQDDEFDL